MLVRRVLRSLSEYGCGGAVVLLLTVGCGGETGEDRGRSGIEQPDASAGESGAGAGGSLTGGAGGQNSTGGIGQLCPEIDCDLDCPSGLWQDEDGCDTCACAAPPLSMPMPYAGAPAGHVSLTGTASEWTGAIDRLTIDLVWRYDEEDMEDEELTVPVTLEITNPPRRYDLDTPVTYDVLEEPPLVLAARAEGGVAMDSSEALTCLGGFLTLSQVGDRLLGGVSLQLSRADIAVGDSVVSGSFDLPAP